MATAHSQMEYRGCIGEDRRLYKQSPQTAEETQQHYDIGLLEQPRVALRNLRSDESPLAIVSAKLLHEYEHSVQQTMEQDPG